MLHSMIDAKLLDDLANRVTSILPDGLHTLHADIEKNVRSILEAGLSHLDLVSRDEFELQSAVLARSREKLERLEQRLAELEQQSS